MFGCPERKRKGKENFESYALLQLARDGGMDGNANLKQWRTLIYSITFMFFFSFLCNQNGISVISETEDNAVGNVQFGAFPVFVVDGTPSPLKSQARIARFFRGSGIDLSGLPVVEEGVSVERNAEFSRRVQECVVSFLPLPFFVVFCHIVLDDFGVLVFKSVCPFFSL